MANNSPQSGQDSKAGPITFVLVAAILSGIWFTQPPLKTFRQGEAFWELLREKEDVQARLWQDPFLAVQKHEQEEEEEKTQDHVHLPHHSFESFTAKNKEKFSQNVTSDAITILINMVDGGPYAESRESRIRHRYAVVSGLGVQNYVPEDSQKIGFFRFPLATEEDDKGKEKKNCNWSSGATKGKCLVVPYEWYKTDPFTRLSQDDNKKSKSILVLWIMDEALHHEKPLHDLHDLVYELKQNLSNFQLAFKVIGPRTTTTLKSMVKELDPNSTKTNAEKGLPGALADVQFFSPWSTAPEWLLTEEPPTGRIQSLFGQNHNFIRTIGTDDQLVEILIEELSRRGVEAGGKDVSIALVSEWDTAYGRALPLTFAAIVGQMKEENVSIPRPQNLQDGNSDKNLALRKKAQDIKANPKNLASLGIKQYAYLRGLDGELPQENSSKTSNSSQESNNSKGLWGQGKEISPDIQRPEGATQIDYVRRLAARIEGEIGKRGPPVKAIGVLGSDVYDKLLILQALRPRFPNALFFTTDLDARVLHPSQKDWTRNLLVASHYGLELHKDLQGMVAPFRDGYQTAVFRSVLQAFCRTTEEPLCDSGYGDKEIRFFEIGMTMPVDLSESNGSNVHPDPLESFSLDWENGAYLGLLLAIALILSSRFFVADFLEGRTWWMMAIFFVVIGLFLWLFVDLSMSIEPIYWKGEPFYWFEGVSIWPSQLLRLTAAFLCICFFCRISWELNGEETSKSAKNSERKKTWWEEVKDKKAQYYEANIPRWGRVVFSSILYICFAWLLMTLIGFPENEGLYRGQVDDTWQRGFVVKGPLMFAVILLIALIWQVIERTLECCYFVRHSIGPFGTISEERAFIFKVANRTEIVGRIIFYPIIALIVLAASRSSLFDNWDLPLSLVLIIGIHFGLMLCCAVLLRVSAENVRKTILKRLEEELFKFTKEGNESEVTCHKFVIDEVRNLKNGAFAPLSQHPIFGAVLYPFGGIGFLVLIEHFIT